MAANWGGDPDVRVAVIIATAGPLDPPGSGIGFNLSDYGGVNYVLGDPGITIRRGRSDEFDNFPSGSCSFVLKNSHREFEPGNSSSPFASILRPSRRVLVVTSRASDPTSLTVLFTGFIDAWPQAWGKTTGTVEIEAHDLLSVLATTDMSPSSGVLILDSPFQGQLDRFRLAGDLPQQFTGERIAALTGLAGISAQSLSLQRGLTETLGLEPTGDVLGLCQEAEFTEAGFLFVDQQGMLTFLDRHSRFQHSRLGTVQTVFTDQEYSGLSVDYGLAQMWNDVRFSRPALSDVDMPTEQIAMNDASIAEFRRKTKKISIPAASDGETLGRAQFWVDRYGLPQQRPSPVTIKPRKNINSLFMRVVRRELLDRIQLVRTPFGIGSPLTFTGLIEQIQHQITNVDWVTSIGISPIDVDEGQNFLILDHGTLGQLDQETLAY